MKLARVRPGDIVRVNKKGRVFEALVRAKRKGELEIEPIQRGITYTTASAREVICHWARRGRPRPPRHQRARIGANGGLTRNESERE
jgi:hypothetical protein